MRNLSRYFGLRNTAHFSLNYRHLSSEMKRIFWIYFALFLFGCIVLAWPEENNLMMIQFSETHGPSKMDVAGILIIMMGYLPMVKEVWKRSSWVKARLGGRTWNFLIGITFISLAAIGWSLYARNNIMLWISVVAAVIAQALLVRIAYRRT